MITIAEHTINEKILKKSGWALDLGCIGFDFSLGVKEYVDNVIGVDANPSITGIDGIIFENKALVTDEKEEVYYNIFNDKQGNSLFLPLNDTCVFKTRTKVKTITMKSLMEKYGIEQFEIIKIDIEGGEYDLLNNLDFTISKQYSVEFHEFRNMNPYYPDNEIYFRELFKRLTDYCDIVQHNLTDHPGFMIGRGRNYWDSLFTLKEKYWK